jgi:hypothetical protein
MWKVHEEQAVSCPWFDRAKATLGNNCPLQCQYLPAITQRIKKSYCSIHSVELSSLYTWRSGTISTRKQEYADRVSAIDKELAKQVKLWPAITTISPSFECLLHPELATRQVEPQLLPNVSLIRACLNILVQTSQTAFSHRKFPEFWGIPNFRHLPYSHASNSIVLFLVNDSSPITSMGPAFDITDSRIFGHGKEDIHQTTAVQNGR